MSSMIAVSESDAKLPLALAAQPHWQQASGTMETLGGTDEYWNQSKYFLSLSSQEAYNPYCKKPDLMSSTIVVSKSDAKLPLVLSAHPHWQQASGTMGTHLEELINTGTKANTQMKG